MKVLTYLFLFIFSTNNGFSYEVSGSDAKSLYKALNNMTSPTCEGKICQMTLSPVMCYTIPIVGGQCSIGIPLPDGQTELQWRMGRDAKKLYKALSALPESGICTYMGVELCGVSEVTCTKMKKFLGSDYHCEYDF